MAYLLEDRGTWEDEVSSEKVCVNTGSLVQEVLLCEQGGRQVE